MLDDRMAGCRLHEGVTPTSDLDRCQNADVYVFAVPTSSLRTFLKPIDFQNSSKVWVNSAKGIEQESLTTAGEVLREFAPEGTEIYTLSGPSHAEELAHNIPTSIVLAGRDTSERAACQTAFSTEYCRVYTSDDRIGVEVAGALKNVVDLAAGISDGLGFGDNTRGALITRGLSEITRIGQALGGRFETFSGLAGMGDLITTCCSTHSRNRKVGYELGKGRALPDILQDLPEVAEGVTTTPAARALGQKHDQELPITEQVYQVLYEHKTPLDAVKSLMLRTLKEEAQSYAIKN
jgi:glycerol-3-phosphate dehydrogenase (NAD(P)+)